MEIASDLEGQADVERFDQGIPGIVDADKAEQKAETDDEVVVCDVFLIHQMALELEMEVARPDEAQHSAGEASDEAHQDGEVRNETSHENCEENDADAPAQTPDLQLAVELPDLWEDCLGLATEESSLEKFTGCEVRQRITENSLDYQAEVYESLEAN